MNDRAHTRRSRRTRLTSPSTLTDRIIADARDLSRQDFFHPAREPQNTARVGRVN